MLRVKGSNPLPLTAGDVLVWDNTQTLHHSYPYDNDGTNKRELYRTQARMQQATERQREYFKERAGMRLPQAEATKEEL